jgi:DNA-binding transcriptional ArsR family regulator
MAIAALMTTHPLLADRVRLALMATLAASEQPLDFTTLLHALELTRGNLSTHLRRLEDDELIEVEKEFYDRKPRTMYRCTENGRLELERYLEAVELAIKSTTTGQTQLRR